MAAVGCVGVGIGVDNGVLAEENGRQGRAARRPDI
jgi:hypothetical protein